MPLCPQQGGVKVFSRPQASTERLAEVEKVYQVSCSILKFPAKVALYLSVYPHLFQCETVFVVAT